MSDTLADLSETDIIQRLRPYCSPVVGDDAAVVALGAGQSLVVTTDVLVSESHFSALTTPPHAVGWRAAAANLSDLAAMGADPLGLTVGLALPETTSWSWLEAVYQGLADCLAQFGGDLLGGDICRAAVASLAITAVGQVRPQQALYRSAAQPGQAIVTTGPHGQSRAGLALLQGLAQAPLTESDRQRWIAAHQYPRPRFDVVHQLRQLTSSAIAAMDSSDGLANAVVQICRSSRVGATLARDRLPVPAGLSGWVGTAQAQHWTLYGGEDFELVLCLPPDLAEQLVSRSAGCAIIGHTTAGPAVELVGNGPPQELTLAQGYAHFAASR